MSKRLVTRIPQPVSSDLRGLVGLFARSKVFRRDGLSLTQEQVVAIAIRMAWRRLRDMSPKRLTSSTKDDVTEVLGLYENPPEVAVAVEEGVPVA